MVRHAPIHRRSGHSDIAICCGRNVRGSSPSTSVVPLSNQVTTLNHKRFKGFKMFSDGHLDLRTHRIRGRCRLARETYCGSRLANLRWVRQGANNTNVSERECKLLPWPGGREAEVFACARHV